MITIFLNLPVLDDRAGAGHHLGPLHPGRAAHGLLHRDPGLLLPADQPGAVPRLPGGVAPLLPPPELLRRPHGRAVHDPHLSHTHHTHEDHIHRQDEDEPVCNYVLAGNETT